MKIYPAIRLQKSAKTIAASLKLRYIYPSEGIRIQQKIVNINETSYESSNV
jgi:hypothetical protein